MNLETSDSMIKHIENSKVEGTIFVYILYDFENPQTIIV